jgi:hypothetical protein
MSVATLTQERVNVGVPHIGRAHHRRRNRWIAFGVIVAALGVTSHRVYWGQQDKAATAQLEHFQAAYAQRCDAAAFPDSSAAMLKGLYLGSSTLRAVVDRQLTALESGASCDAVSRALRAADFPLPATPEKTPTILLQPPSE